MSRRDDILALQRSDPTITQSEVAALLGVTRQTVNNICRIHGIVLNDGRVKRSGRYPPPTSIVNEIDNLRAAIERIQRDIAELKAKAVR